MIGLLLAASLLHVSVQDCAVPKAPANGSVSPASGSVSAGRTITFSCEENAILAGRKTVKCGKNNQWENSIPKCYPRRPLSSGTAKKPKAAPAKPQAKPAQPKPAQRKSTQPKPAQRKSTQPKPVQRRPTQPKVQPKPKPPQPRRPVKPVLSRPAKTARRCERFPAPSHGKVHYTGHLVGHATAHITCEFGYERHGPRTLHCNEDAKWHAIDYQDKHKKAECKRKAQPKSAEKSGLSDWDKLRQHLAKKEAQRRLEAQSKT